MSACPKSTFITALPYGVTALVVGTVGAVVAVTATAVAIKIIGISAAIIGAYGFFSVLICGIVNADNPQKFREDLPKYAGSVIGSAIANIISSIAIESISSLLDSLLGRRNNSIRIQRI